MGLDVSHDCWRGAYSAFKRFRDAIRETAGIDDDAWGEEINHIVREGKVDADLLGDYCDWEPDDDIKYLLAHSDCDGLIWPRHALKIAVRLEELIPELPDEQGGHLNLIPNAKSFVAGCYKAAALGEPLRFG